MGRTVICEGRVLKSLENGIPDKANIYTGLIIGQHAGQRDYVVHLANTRVIYPEDESSNETSNTPSVISKVSEIDENLVSEHAKTVTRMLPGGLWVLGYYVITPMDVFTDKTSVTKLKTLSQALHSSTRGNEFLCGKDPSNEVLIFNYSSLSQKFSCKSLDITSLNSSFRPAAWKVRDDAPNWFKVECKFNLKWLHNIAIPSKNLSTKKKLVEVLSQFQKTLENLVPLLDGQLCSSEETLLSIKEDVENSYKGKGFIEKKNSFNMVFYEFNKLGESETQKKSKDTESSSGFILLGGVISSLAYLNEKASSDDAYKAIKDDLLRSLAARFEMHWQTIEEGQSFDGPYILAYPPRRVLFTPENSAVSYSEYIFDGETENDALATLCENLGFEDGSVTTLEDKWDVSEFTESLSEVDGSSKSKPAHKSKSKKETESLNSKIMIILGLVGAVGCLIISLALQFSK